MLRFQRLLCLLSIHLSTCPTLSLSSFTVQLGIKWPPSTGARVLLLGVYACLVPCPSFSCGALSIPSSSSSSPYAMTTYNSLITKQDTCAKITFPYTPLVLCCPPTAPPPPPSVCPCPSINILSITKVHLCYAYYWILFVKGFSSSSSLFTYTTIP